MAKLSRRKFIGMTSATVAAAYLPWRFGARGAYAFATSPTTIPLFGTTLRGVGPGGIPVAAPDSDSAPVTGVTHYTIDIKKYDDVITPPLVNPLTGLPYVTALFGYHPANPLGGGVQSQKHLGGIIVGKKNEPIQITFNNQLSTGTRKHIIPIDQTIPGAAQMAVPTGGGAVAGSTYSNGSPFRTAVHFHGGLVPWISDGGPFDWWDPQGNVGASFLNNAVLNPGAPGDQAEYYYNLNQSARFGWYHDHAFGITRINAYAGIASGLIIRDDFEQSFISRPSDLTNVLNGQPLVSAQAGSGLPEYIENSVLSGTTIRELPLVIQDKVFVGPGTAAVDPTWSGKVDGDAARPGSLWYAHVYEKNRWKLAATKALPPDPSVIPEFFGDTMLVNGTTFPKAAVHPRRYRLRFLNACNARFLNLQFFLADASPNGITLDAAGIPTNKPAPVDPTGGRFPYSVLQIGTEGGFLPTPVTVPTNVAVNPAVAPATGSLIVAPAERPDVLIDFSACAGKSVILYNDAPAPFPVGDPRTDFFPLWNVKGNPVNATTPSGFGPNTRVLMRFDVASTTTLPADAPLALKPDVRSAKGVLIPGTNLQAGIDAPLIPFGSAVAPALGATTAGGKVAAVRQLTLNEAFDLNGRLIQMLGKNTPAPAGGYGRAYTDASTENPTAGTVEVWEIFNLTADVHPMHFHLVNVQVINRQAFSNFSGGTALLKGAPLPPPPNETGWKETVPMYPGTVTRIIMKFDLTGAAIAKPDGSAFDNSTDTLATGQLPITAGMPPVSPRTGGHEYVWHCHILEHEEHDMMRPLVVF